MLLMKHKPRRFNRAMLIFYEFFIRLKLHEPIETKQFDKIKLKHEKEDDQNRSEYQEFCRLKTAMEIEDFCWSKMSDADQASLKYEVITAFAKFRENQTLIPNEKLLNDYETWEGKIAERKTKSDEHYDPVHEKYWFERFKYENKWLDYIVEADYEELDQNLLRRIKVYANGAYPFSEVVVAGSKKVLPQQDETAFRVSQLTELSQEDKLQILTALKSQNLQQAAQLTIQEVQQQVEEIEYDEEKHTLTRRVSNMSCSQVDLNIIQTAQTQEKVAAMQRSQSGKLSQRQQGQYPSEQPKMEKWNSFGSTGSKKAKGQSGRASRSWKPRDSISDCITNTRESPKIEVEKPQQAKAPVKPVKKRKTKGQGEN
eukprot:UN29549